MTLFTEETVKRMFGAFEAKDMETVLSYFAEDALVIDPHYPTPRMEGKAAIRAGFAWAFANIEQPGFTLLRLWTDGTSGALEMDTHHRIRGKLESRFQQVFIVETRNDQILRLQSYPDYGPHGMQGMFLRLTRLGRRFRRASL